MPHPHGGLEPLARLVLGGWGLYLGEPAPEVPALARFRGWDELLEEAEEGRDPELRFLVRVVAQHGRALPGLVADLRRRARVCGAWARGEIRVIYHWLRIWWSCAHIYTCMPT